MKIATKSKRRWREQSFPRWTKKVLWNLVHYEQSYRRSCWPTLSRQCAFGVCQCIWVRATWLWCWENFTPPSNFPQSDLGRRADSRWALPQISSFIWYSAVWLTARKSYMWLSSRYAVLLCTTVCHKLCLFTLVWWLKNHSWHWSYFPTGVTCVLFFSLDG